MVPLATVYGKAGCGTRPVRNGRTTGKPAPGFSSDVIGAQRDRDGGTSAAEIGDIGHDGVDPPLIVPSAAARVPVIARPSPRPSDAIWAASISATPSTAVGAVAVFDEICGAALDVFLRVLGQVHIVARLGLGAVGQTEAPPLGNGSAGSRALGGGRGAARASGATLAPVRWLPAAILQPAVPAAAGPWQRPERPGPGMVRPACGFR